MERFHYKSYFSSLEYTCSVNMCAEPIVSATYMCIYCSDTRLITSFSITIHTLTSVLKENWLLLCYKINESFSISTQTNQGFIYWGGGGGGGNFPLVRLTNYHYIIGNKLFNKDSG